MIPWRFKLDVFVDESLRTLEFMGQQIYRHDKLPWVSKITDMTTGDCAIASKYFQPLGFDVTLENFESIFNSDRNVYTVSNQYYQGKLIQINFFDAASCPPWFYLEVECVKTLENYSFQFTVLTVNAVSSIARQFVPFYDNGQCKCSDCTNKRISHFRAGFAMDKEKLAEDDVIKDGQLTLRFEFK